MTTFLTVYHVKNSKDAFNTIGTQHLKRYYLLDLFQALEFYSVLKLMCKFKFWVSAFVKLTIYCSMVPPGFVICKLHSTVKMEYLQIILMHTLQPSIQNHYKVYNAALSYTQQWIMRLFTLTVLIVNFDQFS